MGGALPCQMPSSLLKATIVLVITVLVPAAMRPPPETPAVLYATVQFSTLVESINKSCPTLMPPAIQTALRRMSVDPSRVLHVGDSLHSDIGGAGNLGIATCWVCYEDRILDVGTCRADYKIRSLLELRQIL